MAKSSILTPKKTPTKRKYSGSSSVSKRRKSSKSTKKFYKALKKRNKHRGRLINVQEDKEFSNIIKRTQKVTRHQQKIINRRFKNGYSPFEKFITDQIQLTGESEFNKCKWIWRSAAGSEVIEECFANFPHELLAPGGKQAITSEYYIRSRDQTIYFDKVNMKYEIMNPTNYDMNLVVYNIVYKENHQGSSSDGYYESSTNNNYSTGTANPIKLMQDGLDSIQSSGYIVTTPTNMLLNDINLKPTMSYPFNMYCKILKKQIFRLQPGATMTHIFKFKPKALINNGYVGYKYKQNSLQPIKNVTCGCLFKFYGQISSTGESGTANIRKVANASGRLTLKETREYKWYCMTPKYNYVFRNNTNEWAPTDETMEVVNDVTIKPIQEINTDPDDNDPGHLTPPE